MADSVTRLLRAGALLLGAMALASGVLCGELSGELGGGLSYRTSWLGNTYGFGDRRWTPNSVEALAVTPDGILFTNALWDEGGGEITMIRNGGVAGVAESTHGWGNNGGDAIAVGDGYLFAAARITNVGNTQAGKPGYPGRDLAWYGVSRRHLARPELGAPFAGGVGNVGGPTRNSFLVLNAVEQRRDGSPRGLAVRNGVLYVANTYRDAIELYDSQSMQRLARWPAPQPGRIAVDGDGNVWAILNCCAARGRTVVRFNRQGQRGPVAPLPEGSLPVDLALTPDQRLIVADNGPRQNLMLFEVRGDTVRPAGELGERGGAFAGGASAGAVPPGSTGVHRFHGLSALAVDGQGNIYVAMNGVGPRPLHAGAANFGVVLESYAPDGQRRWNLQGLLFLDAVHADPARPDEVYAGTRRFRLDLDKTVPGSEWSYAAITVDPFRYPEDAAFSDAADGRGVPLMRRIQGRLFGFFTDRHAKYLKVYRFDRSHGEVAVPAGFFSLRHIDGAWPPHQPPAGEWIWRDGNGDGRFQPDEFERSPSGDGAPMQAWWVDSRGDVWLGSFAQGIRRFRLQGLDRNGNPKYSFEHVERTRMPRPFTRIQRLQYFPESDTMYLSGATAQKPYEAANWDSTGRVIARYDHWSTGAPVPRYVLDVDRLPGAISENGTEGFAIAGDYLFLVEARNAHVRVIDNRSSRQVGVMTPGPEVGCESGWVDMPMPITALRRDDGEYLVFVEEDAHGKNLMYRLQPPSGVVQQAQTQVHPSCAGRKVAGLR